MQAQGRVHFAKNRVPVFHQRLLWGGWVSFLLSCSLSQANQSENIPEVNGKEKITQDLCVSGAFDHTSRFPAEGNQGGQGQCFAFAAAALLEEQRCTSDASVCGQKLSPIDVARDYPDKGSFMGYVDPSDRHWDRNFFNLANNNQGGSVHALLEAALKYGVCSEKQAPWFPQLESKCKGSSDRSSCVIAGLKKQWLKFDRLTKDWKLSEDSSCYLNPEGAPISRRDQSHLAKLVQRTGAFLDPVEMDYAVYGMKEDEILWLLQESSSQYEFIERVLIPEACASNRAQFQGVEWKAQWTEDWVWTRHETQTNPDGSRVTTQSGKTETHRSLLSNPERMQQLMSRVKETGLSVGLSLCSKSALMNSRSRRDDPRHRETCGPHALVANGLRWNPLKSRCEIHIRNSWGDRTSLKGWLPVEPVLNSTFEVTGIEPSVSPKK